MNIRNLIQEMNELAQEARNGDGYRRYNQRKLCEKFEKLSSELGGLGDKLREAIHDVRMKAGRLAEELTQPDVSQAAPKTPADLAEASRLVIEALPDSSG